MPNNYIVKPGETIGDVVLNATGNFANWDLILEANGFDDWTPDLVAGTSILIPDNIVPDLNTKRQLNIYPAANASFIDAISKIDPVFSTIYDNWILATGFWNDKAIWIDLKSWED